MNPAIYKQPLIFFLGAGASVPLGKKTTVEFYEWLASPESFEEMGDHRPLFSFSSIFQNVKPSDEVSKELDVEAILDFLEELIRAGELVEKYEDADSLKQLREKAEERTGIKARLISSLSVATLKENKQLRDLIKDSVISHYCEVDENEAFGLYEPFFEMAGSLLTGEYGIPRPTEVSFTLPVFTTNYDLVIEKAYEHPKSCLKLIDGFEREKRAIPQWSSLAYQDYEPSGHSVILFKLHGSVDWHLTPAGSIQRIEAKQRDPGQLKTTLIYPSRQKREIHDEPFRTSYDYLFACLAHAKVCVIIGFSFRDQEIVEQFRAAIGVNENLSLLIADPNATSISEHLVRKLGFGPNITPLEIEFAPETKDEILRHLDRALEKT